MNRRIIYTQLIDALHDTPVVFLRGARQVGKTTLVKQLSENASRQYINLDSATALAGAQEDPTGFLQGLTKPATIDEAQRALGLMLSIKEDVDRERVAGRYLLTGSANVLTMPGVSDSLAGRMQVLTLYPLSQGEITGVHEDFINTVFQRNFSVSSQKPLTKNELFAAMTAGGYPEVLSRSSDKRRDAWFESYITTMVERDIRDISNIQDRSGLMRLLRMLGARSGTLYNQSEFSRNVGIGNSTLSRYVNLLESLFLVWFLPAWSSNPGKRLVKSPKVHISDTGLACHLCGADAERLSADAAMAGRLAESFVAGELLRQSSWTEHPASLYHYRSQSGDEVDIVLEDRAGRIVGVEVKLSATLSPRDSKGLTSLRDACGDKFVRGVVIYTGNEIIPLGDRVFAVPFNVLWAP